MPVLVAQALGQQTAINAGFGLDGGQREGVSGGRDVHGQPAHVFTSAVRLDSFAVTADVSYTCAFWAAIHARTVPTFQAVTLSDSLCGRGKVPFFTLRHKVGAENGNGAGVVVFGLCTS